MEPTVNDTMSQEAFEQMAKDAARYRKIRDDLSIETLYYIDKCASTPQEFDDMVDDLLDVSKK